jgi:transglutaminase-like putative cysteine protease
MAKFKIQHLTKYTYEVPVRDSANQIMLYPFSDEYQEILVHTLDVTGNPVIATHIDLFGNKAGTFTHSLSHKELIINSKLEVITFAKAVPEENFGNESDWLFLRSLQFQFPYLEFLKPEQFSTLPELKKIMDEVDGHSLPLQRARYFCQFVFDHFKYRQGVTTIDTTLDEIWELRSGVCQDFAHILLAMLRYNSIPARYVSGYICPNKNGMRGEGATHAWVEAFIPEYGWLGLDPTNNCFANDNHVRLAVGKNYYDCSPVRGTYRGTSKHKLEVAVAVGYEDAFEEPLILPEAKWEKPPANSNSFREFQEKQMQQ